MLLNKNDLSNPSLYLQDAFGRQHTYLRISLTERCNLRCQYCMPEDGISLSPKDHLLTTDEILYLASLFAKQGVTKIRLTGGEPTVNKDIINIIRRIHELPGIDTIGMTTNGLVLNRILPDLQKAGLTALNISLDTLNSDKFEKITRRKGWSRVMAAIDNAVQLGFNPVKVNCVIMRGVNDEEVVDFVALTKDKEIDVRFIEYMPFGGNKWNTDKLVPYKEMMHAIKNRYPNIQRLDSSNFITAKPFKVPSHKGQIGFISSISEPFCGSCNRIRLLADGSLKVCLLGSAEISLRDAIRNNCSEDDILAMISAALLRKKKQHAGMNNLSNVPNRPMILIGG